jgi:small-conductance mechanosensitive channel
MDRNLRLLEIVLRRFRPLFLAIATGLLAITASAAASDPPPGMTQGQFDSLVAEVSETVARSLASRGFAPSATPAKAGSEGDAIADRVTELVEKFPKVVGAIPGLSGQTVRIMMRLDRSPAGGYSTPVFFALLAGCCLAIVMLALGFLRTFEAMHARLSRPEKASAALSAVASLAILDVVALALIWMATRVALGAVFPAAGFQTVFAGIVFDVIVSTAAASCLLEIWLRPNAPRFRIAPVGHEDAVRLKRGIVTAVAVVSATRGWIDLMVTPNMVQAALLINSFIVPLVYLTVALRCRGAFGAWLEGLSANRRDVAEQPAPPHRVALFTRLWLTLVVPLIAFLFLARVYAALSGRPEVPLGTITTVLTLLLLLLGETLIRFVVRHPSASPDSMELAARILRSGSRLARATLVLVALVVLSRVWLVDVSGLIPVTDWPAASRSWWLASLAVLAAAAAWEIVRIATDPFVGPAATSHIPLDEQPEHGEQSDTGSRARTLTPLLRIALLVLIVGGAILSALALLGVNITPLIAGASILGLAVSFGSQTLVRDIVSGVFYLAEDAFRVGEYIDCGKAKGTVEGFALRSIKLRHQSGQLHTIPFGQLGQVTNFSRDWATVKFNMRFARDTDLEILRKSVKKIGQRLAEESEFKDDFLEPLKMQGVIEILDEAILVRFKFTVRPIRPSLIQREAIKRFYRELPAAGISFPQPVVALRTLGFQEVSSGKPAAAAAPTAPLAAALPV